MIFQFFRIFLYVRNLKMKNLAILLLLLPVGLSAQTIFPKEYQVNKTSKQPRIDGRIRKSEWRKAAWTDDFVDITGNPELKPAQQTRCRMLWDDQYLYIAARMNESDLWATLKERDAIIFHDNDFEIFIDPNNDAEQYFEIEVNAFGTVMDLFMNKPYRKGGTYDIHWNGGMITAVKLKGTINNNRDRDKYWTLEMAIPFKGLEKPGRISQPSPGSKWRINFSRVQWTMEPDNSGYRKKKRPDGRNLPEDNWVWSPIGEVNMHIPERWGILTFR
jgi:hypothetical protein